jgi:hypothetical protein
MAYNLLITSVLTFAATSTLFGVLIFILKEWFSARLKESISAEYKKALVVFKDNVDWQSKKKEQAIQVAKIFSLWYRSNYYPDENVNDIRYHLQHEYWQLAMWLDAPILKIVNKTVISVGMQMGHKEAMVAVRKQLWGDDDPIVPAELCHWDALPKAVAPPSAPGA